MVYPSITIYLDVMVYPGIMVYSDIMVYPGVMVYTGIMVLSYHSVAIYTIYIHHIYMYL